MYELSPKGQWCGVFVLHNFYVVIRLLSINNGFIVGIPSKNHPIDMLLLLKIES